MPVTCQNCKTSIDTSRLEPGQRAGCPKCGAVFFYQAKPSPPPVPNATADEPLDLPEPRPSLAEDAKLAVKMLAGVSAMRICDAFMGLLLVFAAIAVISILAEGSLAKEPERVFYLFSAIAALTWSCIYWAIRDLGSK